jgi:hypothetical protein
MKAAQSSLSPRALLAEPVNGFTVEVVGVDEFSLGPPLTPVERDVPEGTEKVELGFGEGGLRGTVVDSGGENGDGNGDIAGDVVGVVYVVASGDVALVWDSVGWLWRLSGAVVGSWSASASGPGGCCGGFWRGSGPVCVSWWGWWW